MNIEYDDEWKVGLPVIFAGFPNIRATTRYRDKKYAGLGWTKEQAREHLLRVINKLKK